MRKILKWLAGIFATIALAVALALAAFIWNYPSAVVRYRLTLHAEADGKPVEGSGVVEVRYETGIKFLTETEYNVRFRGEAVVLDLGEKGLVFALLRAGQDSRSEPATIVLRAFNFSGGAMPIPAQDGIHQVRRLSGKADLPLTSLPLLVRFRNVNDPLTVEKVDPLDLAASLGPGVKLTRATLEIISNRSVPQSEPITTAIRQRLEWLNRIQSNIDGTYTTSSNRLANVLHSGDFERK